MRLHQAKPPTSLSNKSGLPPFKPLAVRYGSRYAASRCIRIKPTAATSAAYAGTAGRNADRSFPSRLFVLQRHSYE
jgi:hypothetical protein